MYHKKIILCLIIVSNMVAMQSDKEQDSSKDSLAKMAQEQGTSEDHLKKIVLDAHREEIIAGMMYGSIMKKITESITEPGRLADFVDPTVADIGIDKK